MRYPSFRGTTLAVATVAVGVALAATQPAAAQFIAPWGVWAGPPQVFEQDDDFVDDRMIPPNVVRNILRSRGYRLVAAPRLSGENIVALGEDARGRRTRFVIDGYSGALVRVVSIGRAAPERYVERSAPEGLAIDGAIDGRPLAESDLTGRPGTPHKPKAKRQTHRQTAVRKQAAPEMAPKPPAPSEATQAPAAPTPQPQAKATSDVKPATEAPPPLAPDAKPPAAAEAPKTAPVDVQATAPAQPAPVEKPVMAPEPKADAPARSPSTDKPPPADKPADIGPRVQPVAPQANAAPPPAEKPKPADAEPTPSSGISY